MTTAGPGEPPAGPPATARRLGLAAHPEGGWFRRTWASPAELDGRPAATAILFLLAPGEESAWHTVDADELWLWHGPGDLVLELGEPGEVLHLGPGTPQGLVPAGRWQRARPAADVEVLVSCVVSPGFQWSGFHLR
ncbi:cupin domain-containing protein [Goekera deserti]|uniref:cupin domain-containing protein n=1 Tax=Goekera deserti TaxID=2497753 RepID=UPI0015772E48|nr:cupin domain-containing protein [Goekera deserti]